LRQFPTKGVLAATRPNDKYVHDDFLQRYIYAQNPLESKLFEVKKGRRFFGD
jgi:hypothetical protein